MTAEAEKVKSSYWFSIETGRLELWKEVLFPEHIQQSPSPSPPPKKRQTLQTEVNYIRVLLLINRSSSLPIIPFFVIHNSLLPVWEWLENIFWIRLFTEFYLNWKRKILLLQTQVLLGQRFERFTTEKLRNYTVIQNLLAAVIWLGFVLGLKHQQKIESVIWSFILSKIK